MRHTCFVCGDPKHLRPLGGNAWICGDCEDAADQVLLDSDASGSRYFKEALDSANECQT